MGGGTPPGALSASTSRASSLLARRQASSRKVRSVRSFTPKSTHPSLLGDEILSIHGRPVAGLTHAEAIAMFKETKVGEVLVTLGRREARGEGEHRGRRPVEGGGRKAEHRMSEA